MVAAGLAHRQHRLLTQQGLQLTLLLLKPVQDLREATCRVGLGGEGDGEATVQVEQGPVDPLNGRRATATTGRRSRSTPCSSAQVGSGCRSASAATIPGSASAATVPVGSLTWTSTLPTHRSTPSSPSSQSSSRKATVVRVGCATCAAGDDAPRRRRPGGPRRCEGAAALGRGRAGGPGSGGWPPERPGWRAGRGGTPRRRRPRVQLEPTVRSPSEAPVCPRESRTRRALHAGPLQAPRPARCRSQRRCW
jgi:hypothetical protein